MNQVTNELQEILKDCYKTNKGRVLACSPKYEARVYEAERLRIALAKGANEHEDNSGIIARLNSYIEASAETSREWNWRKRHEQRRPDAKWFNQEWKEIMETIELYIITHSV